MCKNCGNLANAEDFKLHYKVRAMVCPPCSKNPDHHKPKPEPVKEVVAKPPGWDAEDEYLLKASKMKEEENRAQFSRIPGTNHVQCKCRGCDFSFKFNVVTRMPASCPYCNRDVPKFRMGQLL